MRPKRIFRLNFFDDKAAAMILLGDPNEVRLLVDPKKFISVTEEGVTLSPGLSNSINVQAMSHNLKFGGMVANTRFPLSMVPITPASPLPMQAFSPPLMELLPAIRDLSNMAKAFVG